ncbi:methionyl-tRNA formyltransferase [Actinokineospora inagensis]|uniref:methionyl-tRNA formyltransferase n=1 Tax=Actinokineospora inagensis TaxID=103730 RepID=UPI0012F769EE|nr:formyltransferase family protein [Actinokineospora inagensis]
MTPTRIVLLTETNSKFGAPVLRRLVEYPGVEVVAVVTREPGVLCEYYADDPDPVDVAESAAAAGIPVLRPAKVNDPELVERLRELAPDYLMIANYRLILREPVLAVPARGTVNLHPGPLPRYAGLAPFFWMAKNGERAGGTSMVWTTPEIDGGPLVAQRRVVLNGTETARRIMDLHFQASWQLLDDVLPALITGAVELTDQDGAARTYFGKPRAQDRTLDWDEPVEAVLRTVRACSAEVGALAVTSSGSTFRVLSAEAMPGHAEDLGDPGELRVFGHGVLAIRAADGWLAVTSLGLGADSEPEERLTVTNVPALLDALDLGASG